MTDPLRYYHLETYLFDEVGTRFHSQGWLSAFDLFSIVIWKANRAKSKIAAKLKAVAGTTCLETAARELTPGVAKAADDRARLRVLMVDWKLALPMASAVLTVLYPESFTVYDRRACAQLGGPEFERLANRSNFESIWAGYRSFVAAVQQSEPEHVSLRDKDRAMFGRSLIEQLEADIQRGFKPEG